MTSFKKLAIPYVERGFEVFPLVPGSKRPITPDGVKGASCGWDQIDEWAGDYPTDCNVGIACGPESGELGLVVLDIDAHHGGLDTIRDLLSQRGHDLPRTPSVVTPRGGYHLMFAHCDISNRVNALPGLDVRSTGGYVVGAGSWWDGTNKGKVELEGGGTYDWHRFAGLECAKMPDWLYNLLVAPTVEPAPAPIHIDPSNQTTQYRRMLALARHVERQSPTGGNRNHSLFWAVNEAIRNGLKDGKLLFATFVNAGVNCGLEVKEAEKTVLSALRTNNIAT